MVNTVTGAIIVLLALNAGAWSRNLWFGISTLLLLTGLYVLQGLKKIPADPPHRGALTFLGRRQNIVLEEGWRFLPFFPWVYGVILVNVVRKNLDLAPEDVRTPDLAELSVPVSVTYTPSNLIAYLNSGGESGVNNILTDAVGEAIREWAITRAYGPQNWEEALRARGEALQIVINTLSGRDVLTPLDPAEIALMRAGNGTLASVALGVVINRVNVGEMKVLGALAEAAEKAAIEERERAAETIELEHIAARVAALNARGFSNEEAMRIIQTERKKIIQTISENRLNVSPETRDMITGIVGSVLGGRGGRPMRRPWWRRWI